MAQTEHINPMRIIDKENDITYELDFSRESIIFAEARGFEPEDVAKTPVTKIPEFWFYAFRKNHKNLARSKTDALLEKLGGLTDTMIERLLLLYNQAAMANNIFQKEEDLEKNAKMAVELD